PAQLLSSLPTGGGCGSKTKRELTSSRSAAGNQQGHRSQAGVRQRRLPRQSQSAAEASTATSLSEPSPASRSSRQRLARPNTHRVAGRSRSPHPRSASKSDRRSLLDRSSLRPRNTPKRESRSTAVSRRRSSS